jgi:hypothetical protein
VVCWGGGAGSLPADGSVTAAPTLVPGLEHAVAIAGDDWFFCALDRGGAVRCWGPDLKAAPTGLADVTALSTACALHRDGHVSHWPSQGARPITMTGLGDVAALGGGGGPPCVVARSGAALCWADDRIRPPWVGDRPSPMPGLTHVDEIETSFASASCARRGGDVVCWGDEGPKRAVAVPSIHDAERIAVGEYHACALRRGGRVSCWGHDATDQLGVPSSTLKDARSSRPIDVAGLADVVELEVGGGEPSTGAGSTCVLERDGLLLCWGALVGSSSPTPVDLTVR